MKNSALIVVDMQNDFMEGGTLEVKNASDILSNVNKLINHFDVVVATKDWHPANHSSFASNCNVKPFEQVDGNMKWPDHCVAQTWGSEFHKDVDTKNVSVVFHKGMKQDVESYSGIQDAENNQSGLSAYLESLDVDTIYVCGLASDYCVHHTTMDAWNIFDNVIIVKDAIKAVNSDYYFNYEKYGIEQVTTEEALSL